MSPNDVNGWTFTGHFVGCESCHAPEMDRVPPTWLATFLNDTVTLHTANCRRLREVREQATRPDGSAR